MTQQRRFIQCDVFTATPTRGNALAVIVDGVANGVALTDEQMQTVAAWTNLAETTFLFPPEHPDADYKVRIFTPSREMLFAGHPTLGSCFSWLHTGGKPKIAGLVKQECGVGIVEIDISNSPPAFVAPPTSIDPLPDENLQTIIKALDVNPSHVVNNKLLVNGPTWHVLELETAEQVLAVDSSRVRWPEFNSIGLIAKHKEGAECDYEVRLLAPSSGMSEDPITGSLNAALAIWLNAEGRLDKDLLIAQGTTVNRHGRVYITPDNNQPDVVRIGGHTHLLIEGVISL
ncbi:MAG: PhzF family phenazine biosynthesis protein [Granulosicoccaceae bacterium]